MKQYMQLDVITVQAEKQRYLFDESFSCVRQGGHLTFIGVANGKRTEIEMDEFVYWEMKVITLEEFCLDEVDN